MSDRIKTCDADVVEAVGFPKTAQRYRDTLNENITLRSIKLWPDEDDRYLYGEKPEQCLYRQFPEEFASESERVFQHGDHLTRENLRGKWEIAAELAWRDERIAQLEAQRDALLEALEEIDAMEEDWGMLYANQVKPITKAAIAKVRGDEE